MSALKQPHGGFLIDRYADQKSTGEFRYELIDGAGWDLTPRQLCDLELLLNGAYSPLIGFMDRDVYESVRDRMRLPDGTIWPLAVILEVSQDFAATVSVGDAVALLNPENVTVAALLVSQLWKPDHDQDCEAFFGTRNPAHAGVSAVLDHHCSVCLGGAVIGLAPPTHYDFKLLRHSPAELRSRFETLSWHRVIGFHTRNVLHRAQFQLTLDAAHAVEANLLLHPAIGPSDTHDIAHYARVRCYEQVLKQYPEQTTALSLIELAPRYAGPREALLHGIVRKNHGCTHLIIALDHASPPRPDAASKFYAASAAQELFAEYEAELDITMVPRSGYTYVPSKAQFLPQNPAAGDLEELPPMDDAECRRRLEQGLEFPGWFSFDGVLEQLRQVIKQRHQQGFTVFFTGLSGAGKSTIANALLVKLNESSSRRITLLDGDIVRKCLSSELNFSKPHRDLNILRIGFVATEITRNGGIAICAPIAPYASIRQQVRAMIRRVGGFIEVHVNTPIELCEQRDRKGMYAKARAGLIKNFTGVDDPYEIPENPELRIDTRILTPALAAHKILVKLENLGYIR